MVRTQKVGRCIYCGETDPAPLKRFTDEHPIPYGFGGKLVLPEACCLRCQEIINRDIETPILAHDWGNLREKYRMPSRGKSGRTHVVATSQNGRLMTIPIDDYPAVAPIWRFGTAKLIAETVEVQNRQIYIAGDKDGTEDRRCREAYPEWNGLYEMRVRFDAYARLLAKMAYSWVVATQGSAWFRESITPVIVGSNVDFTTHVGGVLDGYGTKGEFSEEPTFTVAGRGDGTGMVVFHALLFAGDPESRYHVVLGDTDITLQGDTQTVTFSTPEVEDGKGIRIARPATTVA